MFGFCWGRDNGVEVAAEYLDRVIGSFVDSYWFIIHNIVVDGKNKIWSCDNTSHCRLVGNETVGDIELGDAGIVDGSGGLD